MEIRIGVTNVARELEIDMGSEAEAEKVRATITDALSGEEAVLWLTDEAGNEVAVPSQQIGYVEITSDEAKRKFGFSG